MSGDLIRRSSVVDLESAMRGLDESREFVDCVAHHFSQGVYVREVKRAADTVIVGKIHRFGCTNVLLDGKMFIESEFESGLYEGPMVWVSPPGNKRAVYYIEDTRWMTIHQNPTNTQDMDELERLLIADDFSALEES